MSGPASGQIQPWWSFPFGRTKGGSLFPMKIAFIGTSAFAGTGAASAGELRYTFVGAYTFVQGGTAGNGSPPPLTRQSRRLTCPMDFNRAITSCPR